MWWTWEVLAMQLKGVSLEDKNSFSFSILVGDIWDGCSTAYPSDSNRSCLVCHQDEPLLNVLFARLSYSFFYDLLISFPSTIFQYTACALVLHSEGIEDINQNSRGAVMVGRVSTWARFLNSFLLILAPSWYHRLPNSRYRFRSGPSFYKLKMPRMNSSLLKPLPFPYFCYFLTMASTISPALQGLILILYFLHLSARFTFAIPGSHIR